MTSLVESEVVLLLLRPLRLRPVTFMLALGIVAFIVYAILASNLDLLLLTAATAGAALVWAIDAWHFSYVMLSDKRIVQSRALGLLIKEVPLSQLSVTTRDLVLKGQNPDTPALRLSSPRTTIEINPYTFGAPAMQQLIDELSRQGFAIPDRILEWLDWELNPAPD